MAHFSFIIHTITQDNKFSQNSICTYAIIQVQTPFHGSRSSFSNKKNAFFYCWFIFILLIKGGFSHPTYFFALPHSLNRFLRCSAGTQIYSVDTKKRAKRGLGTTLIAKKTTARGAYRLRAWYSILYFLFIVYCWVR